MDKASQTSSCPQLQLRDIAGALENYTQRLSKMRERRDNTG